MQDHVFDAFRALIVRESGIDLQSDKKQLLMARIQRRLRELDLVHPSDYLRIIETDATGDELVMLLNSVSTNVTFFYREPSHFAFLQKILTEWKEQKQKKLRIWCAASSSGEEPYTLAMVVNETWDTVAGDAKILATDLCTKVLDAAVAGEYPAVELRRLPPHLAQKYFVKVASKPTHVRVTRLPERLVMFRQLNLIHIPYPLRTTFDFIFCRNVMIYFSLETRRMIVQEFARLIRPGGYLVLSHSENLIGIDAPFKRLEGSVYLREK